MKMYPLFFLLSIVFIMYGHLHAAETPQPFSVTRCMKGVVLTAMGAVLAAGALYKGSQDFNHFQHDHQSAEARQNLAAEGVFTFGGIILFLIGVRDLEMICGSLIWARLRDRYHSEELEVYGSSASVIRV